MEIYWVFAAIREKGNDNQPSIETKNEREKTNNNNNKMMIFD